MGTAEGGRNEQVVEWQTEGVRKHLFFVCEKVCWYFQHSSEKVEIEILLGGVG